MCHRINVKVSTREHLYPLENHRCSNYFLELFRKLLTITRHYHDPSIDEPPISSPWSSFDFFTEYSEGNSTKEAAIGIKCSMHGWIVKYRVIHKSVKYFKNSQQIDYATDHGILTSIERETVEVFI